MSAIILGAIGALIALALWFLFDWIKSRTDLIARERMIADMERHAKRRELARQWEGFVRSKRDEWDLKIARGVVLDLHKDGRQGLLGKSAKDLEWAKRQSLRKDVREWCKDNCQGEFSVVPTFDGQNRHMIWFAEDNDAFMFKLRWY